MHGFTTLRFKLLHIPARIVSHARQTWIQLSSANVFDRLFWQVLHRIQHR
ncbi:transposase [Lactiplantibacillus sp. WILCCON 0030]|uniref:Transposase n=1 Tax=Lactiplantibacillus brownii TaxID=3069269 RepID=A0ABU1ABK4_9LACO|nr:transposase [Lactiplantibacillus brownii]MDQ7938349.1 transposase [Lactiplantibacillus brownii]